MKIYIISFTVGIIAGLLYGVLNVRSPAPPVAALIGLLGMLIGEQIVPYGKQLIVNSGFSSSATQKLSVQDIEQHHISDSAVASENRTKSN